MTLESERMVASLPRIEALFHAALALPADQRDAFLHANETSADIRATVVHLLQHDHIDANPLNAALGAALNLSADVPQQIGRYRVIAELGHGGTASVLLAERDIDGSAQRVALKLLYGASTAYLRRKAARERTLLAALNHRGIAALIDGGETDAGVPYLVMESVEGAPLLDYLAAHHCDVPSRLQLFRQLCLAMEHAHQRLILHLDLKPSNVLVREDGSTALLDFGIGQQIDAATEEHHTAAFTPTYAAPEQRNNSPLTTVTDVYGAGLLLFEILTDGALGAQRRTNGTLPPTTSALEDRNVQRRIGGDLNRLIARATAENPNDRYVSMTALRMDVDNFIAGRVLDASHPSWWRRLTKFCRRNAWPVASAAVVLLLAAGFVAQLSIERTRALAAEKNALLAQDMQTSVLAALSPPGNPQAQAKIQELLRSERQRLNNSGDGRVLDSTWRSITSVVTVAEIYTLIGDPEPALKTSDIALRMISELGAERAADPDLLARASATRAMALNDLERFDESKLVFKHMLEIREKDLQRDPVAMLRALVQYASAAIGWDDYVLAESLLKKAQTIADHNQIPTEDRILLGIKSLNSITNNESEAIESQTSLGQQRLDALMTLANTKLTAQAPEWIGVWSIVSTFHYRHGRYDEALSYIDRALERSRAAYGERSTGTANILSFRASLLNDLGRHREALENFNALRVIQASISPNKTALLAKLDGQRAAALLQMGDYIQAAKAAESAVRGLSITNPTEHRWRTISLSILAQSNSGLGRHAQAVAAADEMMASLNSLPFSALDRAMAPVSMSDIWLEAKQFDKVQTALDQADVAFRALLPADHPTFINLAQRRGRLAYARGHFADADRQLASAVALLDRGTDDPVLRGELILTRAQAVYRLGDHARALTLANQALKIIRAQTPPDAESLGEAKELFEKLRIQLQ